jgi:signal transduction histidine kinase
VLAHGGRQAIGATMGVMWTFMILVWRMLSKVLRRFGRWALLAPVAAIGVALFGLNSWTAVTLLVALLLAVVLALILLGRTSAGAVSLLPVTMLATGICGLSAAASMAGSWAQGGFSLWQTVTAFTAPGQTVKVFGTPGAPRRPVAPWPPKSPAQGTLSGVGAKANFIGPRFSAQALARSRKIIYTPGPARGQVIIPAHSLLWARLLVLGSLLLLAIGLWLAPRALADLRTQFAKVAPHLRRWAREGNWGILLVPVMSFGLTMFGVRPWTVAAIIVAVVITIRWPRLAADLVPLVLVLFALYGFMLASRWVAGPRSLGNPGVTWFGAVPVDSSPTSLLAGVEASALLAFGAWLFPRTLGAHAGGKGTSKQAAELTARVERLTETRNQAVDAAAAELRRIERDLHDGTQARLVALGMSLRALERMLPASSPAALALVAEARETSLHALNDLRHLVRGIYPPVLADRGLAHATKALALDAPLPVELDIDLPGRLSPPVESACYFAVAEMLANAVKHSGARRVHIRMEHTAGVLRIEVADDGTGGADPARGILAVSSPPGGPTMIAMEVPCVLSSPRTCSC